MGCRKWVMERLRVNYKALFYIRLKYGVDENTVKNKNGQNYLIGKREKRWLKTNIK